MMHVANSQRLCYQLLDSASTDDLDFLHRLDSDPTVMRFINGGEAHSRQYIQQVYVPRLNAFSNPTLGWGLWKVSTLDNLELGWLLIRPMNLMTDNETELDNLEIGWRFKQTAWGKGFATEAAQHLINHFSLTTNAPTKFSAIADENNHGSINVMQRLGMRYVNTTTAIEAHGEIQVVLYEKEVLQPQD